MRLGERQHLCDLFAYIQNMKHLGHALKQHQYMIWLKRPNGTIKTEK